MNRRGFLGGLVALAAGLRSKPEPSGTKSMMGIIDFIQTNRLERTPQLLTEAQFDEFLKLGMKCRGRNT